MHPPSLALTTSGKGSERLITEARAAATASGIRCLERRPNDSRQGLLETAGVDALVVLEAHRVSLVDREGVLRFAAGLAHLRIKQLEAGAPDRLAEAAGFRPGDQVLDCTLGLAADAQVASWAVGPTGHVTGLESSPALVLLVRHGLLRLERPSRAAPIDVVHTDADAFLRRQPERSFDVVLLDPMFRYPRKASPAFQLLRRYADHRPLTQETLAEARRVARRRVVVKGAGGSRDLERLGLTPLEGRRGARVEWAVAGPLYSGPHVD